MFEATSKTITKTSIYLQQEYIHKGIDHVTSFFKTTVL